MSPPLPIHVSHASPVIVGACVAGAGPTRKRNNITRDASCLHGGRGKVPKPPMTPVAPLLFQLLALLLLLLVSCPPPNAPRHELRAAVLCGPTWPPNYAKMTTTPQRSLRILIKRGSQRRFRGTWQAAATLVRGRKGRSTSSHSARSSEWTGVGTCRRDLESTQASDADTGRATWTARCSGRRQNMPSLRRAGAVMCCARGLP